MIRVVIPDPGSWLFTHPGSRIQGVKKAPYHGSPNTGKECVLCGRVRGSRSGSAAAHGDGAAHPDAGPLPPRGLRRVRLLPQQRVRHGRLQHGLRAAEPPQHAGQYSLQHGIPANSRAAVLLRWVPFRLPFPVMLSYLLVLWIRISNTDPYSTSGVYDTNVFLQEF